MNKEGMANEPRGNLSISGIGSSRGGAVRSARIDGIGKVDGDVSCADFRVNGKADIHGSVEAKTTDIHGTAAVEGSLRSDKIQVHGNLNVGGDLTGENIRLHGTVSVKGDCEAELLDADGRLQMNAINAGTVRIALHGSSNIAEIGGEHIAIRKQSGSDLTEWLPLPNRFSSRMNAQVIEGDNVYLEYTSAQVVRGNEVTIGPGCEIELIEYRTIFNRDAGSKVGRAVQL